MKLTRTLEMSKHVYFLNEIEKDTTDVESCLNKFNSSLKVRLCFWIIRQQKQKKTQKIRPQAAYCMSQILSMFF